MTSLSRFARNSLTLRKCVNKNSVSHTVVRSVSGESGRAKGVTLAPEVETVIAALTDGYGRLVGKRFDRSFFDKSVAKDGTHACNYLLTCGLDMEVQNGFESANWAAGYGDYHMNPDMSTLREATWLAPTGTRTGLVLCDVMDPKTHGLVEVAPRSILKNTIQRVSDKHGLFCNAASELEYYIFENSYRQAKEVGYSDKAMKPAGDFVEDYHILQGTRTEWLNSQFRRELHKSGIPVECTKGEAGYGQHELNVEYSDILTMADRHVIYKQCLKEIAELNGVSVTFMAKPFTHSTGSGCHIHLSMHDNDTGKNVFSGDERIGRLQSGCSLQFKQFLAGWMKFTPELFPFFAPTANSYKRFVTESWAPTKCAWSFDNRTAGFRVVGEGKSLRIELRIPGADINPYLAFAASLNAGMAGIEKELTLPDPFDGDIYNNDDLENVPNEWHTSLERFRNSEFANECFGEKVVNHYAHFYELERQRYVAQVSDWERNRYFEMI